jgi:hypothetical protein
MGTQPTPLHGSVGDVSTGSSKQAGEEPWMCAHKNWGLPKSSQH